MTNTCIIQLQQILNSVVFTMIGICGGIVGLIGGCISICEIWTNRKPKLKLFAPFYWHGQNTKTGLVLSILLRISNSTKKSAFLYFETISVEIKKNNIWTKGQVLTVMSDTIACDLPIEDQAIYGISKVAYLNSFTDAVIERNNPLTRYIAIGGLDKECLLNPEGVRITVEDCYHKVYTLSVDSFVKQKNKHFRNIAIEMK